MLQRYRDIVYMMHPLLFLAFFVLAPTFAQNECQDEADYILCYTAYITGQCYGPTQSQMLLLCRLSCGLCHLPVPVAELTTNCQDDNPNCSRWLAYCEEGSAYYNFMKQNCRKTCTFCTCEDTHISCQAYKEKGYCAPDNRFYRFMLKRCAQSCSFCSSPSVHPMKPMVTTKEFECNFDEHECDWLNEFIEDTADWLVGYDPAGPISGHGGNGSYLYLNSQYRNSKAVLLLPWEMVLPQSMLKENGAIMCFHFAYVTSGGTITIRQGLNPTERTKSPVSTTLIERTGGGLNWTESRVSVNAGYQYYLTITGIKSREGAVTLDSIFFTKGPCARREASRS